MQSLRTSADHTRSAWTNTPTFCRLWAIAFLLGLVGYGIALSSGFVSDDYAHFFRLMPDGQPEWSHAVGHWMSDRYFGNLRPIVTIYELTLLSLFGVDPLPMRLVGLALHAANAALVGLIMVRLEAPQRSAYLAAALAATAPLGPETVVWIGAHTGVLCAFFGLFSVLWSLDWMTRGDSKVLVGVGAGLALALASKEEGLAFVAMLGGIGVWGALNAAVVDKRQGGTENKVLRAAMLIALASVALLAYSYWRRAALGTFLPPFYETANDPLNLIAISVYNVLSMIARPTNVEHWGSMGALANHAVGVAYLLAIFGALLLYRQRFWPLLLFAGFFVAAVIPAHSVLSFDVEPGLTNSRFAYLSCLLVAGAAGILVAGRLRFDTGPAARLAQIVGASALVGLQALVLAANGHAWRHAADTLEHIRAEAAALSGADPTMPIVNLPDRIDGVFASRGGWPYFRFAPFDPSAPPWREQRSIFLALEEPAYAITTAAGNGTGYFLDMPQSPGSDPTRIDLWFEPERPGAAELSLEVRSRQSDCLMARIVASGRSVGNAFTMTALAGTAIMQSRSRDRIVLSLGVIDAPDGTPARSLRVRLPDGAPWRLDVRAADGTPLNRPADLGDGEAVSLRLTLTRRPDAPAWPAIALLVGARNAFDIPALGAASLPPIEVAPRLAFPESAPPPAGAKPDIANCSAPAEIAVDFGLVPLNGENFFIGAHLRPVNAPERPVLFWDDVVNHMRRLEAVYTQGTVAAWSARELRSWRAVSADLEQSWPAPDFLAFLSRTPGLMLISPDLDLQSSAVTHLIVEMRLVGVPNPYGSVGWSEANSDRGTGSTSFVSHPDGRWRTYAVSLHDLAAWRASGSVGKIRLTLFQTTGYAEVRRVALIDVGRLRLSEMSQTEPPERP